MLIDCGAHPSVQRNSDLQEYMPAAWRTKFYPRPERYHYAHPRSEFLDGVWPDRGYPASDATLFKDYTIGHNGADCVVLVPLTRGLSPDVDLGTVICAATNDWLADKWLEDSGSGPLLVGSIRVNPHDPEGAVREIRRWRDHPLMVQVAVPLEAHEPYGKRAYFPIWAAAAEAQLPIVVNADLGAGVEFYPSPVGYFRHYIEYSAYYSMNFFYHLSSLIAEGVFGRLPRLQFVFGDGGADVLMPLMWRLDEHWRALRFEHPWTTDLPTTYLGGHVHFWAHRMEGGAGEGSAALAERMFGHSQLLLYASRYPYWTAAPPWGLKASVPAAARGKVLGAEAYGLYAKLRALRPDPSLAEPNWDATTGGRS
jgi:predicted TIM-barrel fold metal-dependent hydrolase